MSAGNTPAVEVGPEVPEVDTEHLGFKALSQGGAGPKKVKILPEPWPTDNAPPACASLLSIASKPGLLAAAGPSALVVASTEKVRKAFEEKAGQGDVVSDFSPDVTLPVPRLRHVAFSVDGDFLVISAEDRGGLAVFDQNMVLKGKRDPEIQIDTEQNAVRALLPNPTRELAHFFAAVYESGKLVIANIADGTSKSIRADGVTCVAWSTKGKALVTGLQDGSLAIHMNNGDLKAVIPRPPEVQDGFIVSGIAWLNNEEFLVVHSPKGPESQDQEDSKYNVIKSNKGWTSLVFHPFAWDPLFIASEVPTRAFPPRFSATRLRNWQPDLDDMLIITNSHTDAIAVLASTSDKISPNQENTKELMLIAVDDSRKAAAPRTVYGEEEGDSAFIGEALDLSSTEKLLAPVPALVEEGINEAPWPLPAYMGLTHEGMLAAWWVLWDKSIKAGKRYPGLIFGSEEAGADIASPQPATTPARPMNAGNSAFSKPSATFGTPTTTSPFGSPAGGLMKPTPPGFGTPGFGSTSSFASAKTAQPAFGQASTFGQPGMSGFGATGGLGSKPSPWGTSSQPSQTQASPFAAAAGGASGFAKFGQQSSGSTFSSFGSNAGAQSGFASLGQNQSKSPFGALKSEQSMGSTITIGSATGSSLPSWANTPAQGGSIFGQSKSSFNTASFESKSSEISEGDDSFRRQRDEATPTPQPPPQQAKGLFGLAGDFKLGSTFKSDGTAKDDLPKPAESSNGSFFGGGFGGMLPTTPSKEAPKNVSTTPASPPKPKSLFPAATPAKDSATPKAPPPAAPKPADDAPLPPDFLTTKPPKVDDAPLPPDFLPTKPSKAANEDLPPLAGSPGVKVEAPSSEIEVSPLDDEDGEDEESFSEGDEGDDEEEEEEEEEAETEAHTPAVTKQLPPKAGGWTLKDSVNQSPQFFPPAPTPPTNRTGLQFNRGTSPTRPTLFAQQAKAGSQLARPGSLFGQQTQAAPFSLTKHEQPPMPAQPIFPPPANRAQDTLRSPSPVRSVSTSAIRATRRDPLVPPGSSLSSSIQQPKPPTPQPEVSDLEDEEDERMRAQLAQPIHPSRTLDEFAAHQNYRGGAPKKTGHAAQIEMIYKDINGMVDALGWNARSIRSFTEYHKYSQHGHKVDRNTIDDVADEGIDGPWFEKFALCEIVTLKALEDELEQELDAGRVQDLLGKLTQLARLLREKAKLMTRINDIRRQIINRKDPSKTEALRKAPLPKELADGQRALRNDYAQLLTSLHKAEDATSILRSRLASHNAQNGKTGAVPTMDAVKRTIIKLTTLAEKRNSDITLLESQMRKIGLEDGSRGNSSSPSRTPRRSRGPSMRSSMAESTPFVTPPTHRVKMSLSELNRRARTPEKEFMSTPGKGYGLDMSPGGVDEVSELVKLSDTVDENIEELKSRNRKRRHVADGLRKALVERGVRRAGVIA